jgi:ferredoxin
MSYARQLLDTYPRTFNVDAGVLAATIDALNDCAQACTADADDDLSEQNLAELVKCIRLCLDCADVCAATVGGHQPPDRVRRRRHQAGAGGLRGHLQELRRRVRAACPDARALPGLRRGLPALRAGLPRPPGRHEIADRLYRLTPTPTGIGARSAYGTAAGSSPTWSKTWVMQRNGIRGDKDGERTICTELGLAS